MAGMAGVYSVSPNGANAIMNVSRGSAGRAIPAWPVGAVDAALAVRVPESADRLDIAAGLATGQAATIDGCPKTFREARDGRWPAALRTGLGRHGPNPQRRPRGRARRKVASLAASGHRAAAGG